MGAVSGCLPAALSPAPTVWASFYILEQLMKHYRSSWCGMAIVPFRNWVCSQQFFLYIFKVLEKLVFFSLTFGIRPSMWADICFGSWSQQQELVSSSFLSFACKQKAGSRTWLMKVGQEQKPDYFCFCYHWRYSLSIMEKTYCILAIEVRQLERQKSFPKIIVIPLKSFNPSGE